MILPANIDIIEENHKANGCFLEKTIAPEILDFKHKKTLIDISSYLMNLMNDQSIGMKPRNFNFRFNVFHF